MNAYCFIVNTFSFLEQISQEQSHRCFKKFSRPLADGLMFSIIIIIIIIIIIEIFSFFTRQNRQEEEEIKKITALIIISFSRYGIQD